MLHTWINRHKSSNSNLDRKNWLIQWHYETQFSDAAYFPKTKYILMSQPDKWYLIFIVFAFGLYTEWYYISKNRNVLHILSPRNITPREYQWLDFFLVCICDMCLYNTMNSGSKKVTDKTIPGKKINFALIW